MKPILPILLAPAVLLALVACGGAGEPEVAVPGPAGTGVPLPTAAPIQGTGPTVTPPPTGSAFTENELNRLVEAVSNLKSFRADIKIEAAGANYEGTMDVALPDRQHLRINGAALGLSGDVEMITIGPDIYVKTGGVWRKQTAPGATGLEPDAIAETVAAVRRLAAGSARGGTATVNGKTCQLYTVASGPATSEYCIADNLPVRIATEGAGRKMTIVFSEFNANFDIRPPL